MNISEQSERLSLAAINKAVSRITEVCLKLNLWVIDSIEFGGEKDSADYLLLVAKLNQLEINTFNPITIQESDPSLIKLLTIYMEKLSQFMETLEAGHPIVIRVSPFFERVIDILGNKKGYSFYLRILVGE